MISLCMVVPNPDDATAFYRAMGPISRLRKEMDITIAMPLQASYWAPIGLYDVVFMQRPFSKEHVQFAKVTKDYGVPLWLDYDDDLFNVPRDNPAYQVYGSEECMKRVATILTLADRVTVSTLPMKERWQKLNKNITVIPNAINLSMPVVKNRNPPKERLNAIYWRGSNTHQRDIVTVGSELIDLAAEHKTWAFHFHGYNPWFLTERMAEKQAVVVETWLHTSEFYTFLAKTAPPILIVPLAANDFNLAKSNIAAIEAAMCGAVCVAPKFMPEFNMPGVQLYDNPTHFKRILESLISGKVNLEAEVQRTWDYVSRELSLDKMNQLRKKILIELAGKE